MISLRYNFTPKEISKEEALAMIQKYHYSNTLPKLNKHFLGFYLDDELVGVVTLGWGTRPRRTIQRIFPSLDTKDYLEIGRMCMIESMPRNSETQMISCLVKWIKANIPELKVLFTWADGMMGKPGYVYQAANFIYAGYSVGEQYIKDGVRIHIRQMRSLLPPDDKDGRITTRLTVPQMKKYGVEHYKGRQFRYFLFLCDKREKKRLLNECLVRLDRPYPKEKNLSWRVRDLETGKWRKASKPEYVTDISAVTKGLVHLDNIKRPPVIIDSGVNIGMLDLDNTGEINEGFPNLALMKLSAYHKSKGDHVEWVNPNNSYDVVYISKVFSFSRDPDIQINAKKIIRGGSGYAIDTVGETEIYRKELDRPLPQDIEHIFPDYSLYGNNRTAYGFLTRGCPRGCKFCIVSSKEGRSSQKVADLTEFWNGQKNIEILDPNTFACSDWECLIDQLIESKAKVNFNQGVDIRVMNEGKMRKLTQVRTKQVHFAWDRYEDKDIIVPKLKEFRDISGWNKNKVTVYVLTNFGSTIEQDVERVETIREIGFQPYIMRYNKSSLKRGHILNKLARYVNAKWIFWQCPSFEQYVEDMKTNKWV